MKHLIFILLSLFAFQPAGAIGFYQPGDTLYIWAVSGLTLRKEASLKAAKLATIPYGTLVVAQNYSGDNKVEVEAVPGFTHTQGTFPPVTLKGSFAKVIFQGDTGYVFDGYLSRLPALKYSNHKQEKKPFFEEFGVWAKRNFRLVAEQKNGTWEHGTPSSARWVYGNGFTTTCWAEKGSEIRMILPDVSLEEAFLIFNYTENYEWEVRHPSDNPLDYSWSFAKINDVEWVFGNGLCGYKILYLPYERMAVITSECSC